MIYIYPKTYNNSCVKEFWKRMGTVLIINSGRLRQKASELKRKKGEKRDRYFFLGKTGKSGKLGRPTFSHFHAPA